MENTAENPSQETPITQSTVSSTPTDTTPQNQSVIVTSGTPPQDHKFTLLIGIVIFLAIVFWGGVGYLYFTNTDLRDEIASVQNQNLAPEKQPSPTPEPLAQQISIGGGSIVRTRANGDSTILIDKSDFPSTGIIGFLQVLVSPDNNYMCFESRSPAPEPALYLAKTDGTNLVEVSPNRVNCIWAKSSQAIFYTDTPVTTQPVNIYMYDLNTKSETNLTESIETDNQTRQFSLVSVSENGEITCSFKDYDSSLTEIQSGSCRIDISSGTPVYFED